MDGWMDGWMYAEYRLSLKISSPRMNKIEHGNRMYNANVVYRTEVYRISICFVIDNNNNPLLSRKEQRTSSRYDLSRNTSYAMVYIYICMNVCLQYR